MQEYWKIHLEKPSYKFSAAHMTIFPDGSKEPLHGHNYQVKLALTLSKNDPKNWLDFSLLKSIAKPICEELDEKIIIAGNNQHTSILDDGNGYNIKISNKEYRFPKDEVILLDIDNVTVEFLAQIFCIRLIESIRTNHFRQHPEVFSAIQKISVRIDETLGQGASFTIVEPGF